MYERDKNVPELKNVLNKINNYTGIFFFFCFMI